MLGCAIFRRYMRQYMSATNSPAEDTLERTGGQGKNDGKKPLSGEKKKEETERELRARQEDGAIH